jgi:glycosyltransferase involved in cell wall biosynthesis
VEVESNARILLVEHLDAIGASLADLRPRAQVLKQLGAEVRMMALTSEADHDLQHGTAERRQPDIERLDESHGGDAVRHAAEAWEADAIVWASAAPGGGESAQALGSRSAVWWWPTGWSASRTSGALAALAPGLTPGDACVVDGERPRGPRLSLWDGPYALAASPLRPADAEHLFDGFARATEQRDEVDLVVLDDPDAELEALARRAGIGQRVHFVGRAPREAECAWLLHARVAFVSLQRPLAAGLVVRALAAGCPLLPLGSASEPVSEWLREQGAAWSKPGRARLGWDTVAAALGRTPAVETAVARGRARASEPNTAALASRFAGVLAAARGSGQTPAAPRRRGRAA